jgi:hypothetical protein
MEKLIRDSQMDESEKTMWLELLPSMNSTQKNWLRTIIETENRKLYDLELKYGKLMVDEEKVKFRKIELVRLTA